MARSLLLGLQLLTLSLWVLLGSNALLRFALDHREEF